MSKIISIANQKGGVGKTTTCINFGTFLALHDKKVLIIDMDPQGNATGGLGIEKKHVKNYIYNVLIEEVPINKAIANTVINNLDIIPSNVDLAGAEVELVHINNGREKILKKVIISIINSYDYILIDCPPSLSLLTINSFSAANSILIPMQGEFFALQGLTQLMNTIRLTKKVLNKNLEIEGVLLTMFDSRSNLAASVTDEIYKYFGKKVYETKIPRNIKLGEAPSFGLPIALHDPRCAGAKAYNAFTEEFLTKNNISFTPITDINKFKVV